MELDQNFSRRVFLLVVALSIALEAAAILVNHVNAQTQPTPSDDAVNAVASQLYCPVCENIPLDVCSTQACVQWRELIREKLAQGWTATQVKAYFVQQYGDRVLAVPPREGINWLIYILPPVIVIAALLVVLSIIKRRQPLPVSADEEVSHFTNGELSLLEKLNEDLKKEN